MFAHLALTNQEYYVPRCFWNAFKDYDGQRLNLREHQDAYEFFTRLQVMLMPCGCNWMCAHHPHGMVCGDPQLV